MKILHLGRFLDENNGGLEQTVIDLLDALSEEVEVENLVAHRRFNLRSTIDIFHGWKVYRTASLGMYFSTAFSFPFPFRLRRLYARENYDIVHLHFPDPLSCLSALMLPRTANIVISWHSDVIRQKAFLKFYQPFVNRTSRIQRNNRRFSTQENMWCLTPSTSRDSNSTIAFAPGFEN